MESAFSTLGFVIFGLWISIDVIVVESHRVNAVSELPSFESSHSPSPSRPAPQPSARSAGPPKSPSSPKRQSPPPKKSKQKAPPPPLSSPSPQPQPPPPPPPSAPPLIPSADQTHRWNAREPKRQSHQMNAGKGFGLLFLGMAAIMQIVVVGFLVFKRRQLLMTKDRYETGS